MDYIIGSRCHLTMFPYILDVLCEKSLTIAQSKALAEAVREALLQFATNGRDRPVPVPAWVTASIAKHCCSYLQLHCSIESLSIDPSATAQGSNGIWPGWFSLLRLTIEIALLPWCYKTSCRLFIDTIKTLWTFQELYSLSQTQAYDVTPIMSILDSHLRQSVDLVVIVTHCYRIASYIPPTGAHRPKQASSRTFYSLDCENWQSSSGFSAADFLLLSLCLSSPNSVVQPQVLRLILDIFFKLCRRRMFSHNLQMIREVMNLRGISDHSPAFSRLALHLSESISYGTHQLLGGTGVTQLYQLAKEILRRSFKNADAEHRRDIIRLCFMPSGYSSVALNANHHATTFFTVVGMREAFRCEVLEVVTAEHPELMLPLTDTIMDSLRQMIVTHQNQSDTCLRLLSAVIFLVKKDKSFQTQLIAFLHQLLDERTSQSCIIAMHGFSTIITRSLVPKEEASKLFQNLVSSHRLPPNGRAYLYNALFHVYKTLLRDLHAAQYTAEQLSDSPAFNVDLAQQFINYARNCAISHCTNTTRDRPAASTTSGIRAKLAARKGKEKTITLELSSFFDPVTTALRPLESNLTTESSSLTTPEELDASLYEEQKPGASASACDSLSSIVQLMAFGSSAYLKTARMWKYNSPAAKDIKTAQTTVLEGWHLVNAFTALLNQFSDLSYIAIHVLGYKEVPAQLKTLNQKYTVLSLLPHPLPSLPSSSDSMDDLMDFEDQAGSNITPEQEIPSHLFYREPTGILSSSWPLVSAKIRSILIYNTFNIGSNALFEEGFHVFSGGDSSLVKHDRAPVSLSLTKALLLLDIRAAIKLFNVTVREVSKTSSSASSKSANPKPTSKKEAKKTRAKKTAKAAEPSAVEVESDHEDDLEAQENEEKETWSSHFLKKLQSATTTLLPPDEEYNVVPLTIESIILILERFMLKNTLSADEVAETDILTHLPKPSLLVINEAVSSLLSRLSGLYRDLTYQMHIGGTGLGGTKAEMADLVGGATPSNLGTTSNVESTSGISTHNSSENTADSAQPAPVKIKIEIDDDDTPATSSAAVTQPPPTSTAAPPPPPTTMAPPPPPIADIKPDIPRALPDATLRKLFKLAFKVLLVLTPTAEEVVELPADTSFSDIFYAFIPITVYTHLMRSNNMRKTQLPVILDTTASLLSILEVIIKLGVYAKCDLDTMLSECMADQKEWLSEVALELTKEAHPSASNQKKRGKSPENPADTVTGEPPLENGVEADGTEPSSSKRPREWLDNAFLVEDNDETSINSSPSNSHVLVLDEEETMQTISTLTHHAPKAADEALAEIQTYPMRALLTYYFTKKIVDHSRRVESDQSERLISLLSALMIVAPRSDLMSTYELPFIVLLRLIHRSYHLRGGKFRAFLRFLLHHHPNHFFRLELACILLEWCCHSQEAVKDSDPLAKLGEGTKLLKILDRPRNTAHGPQIAFSVGLMPLSGSINQKIAFELPIDFLISLVERHISKPTDREKLDILGPQLGPICLVIRSITLSSTSATNKPQLWVKYVRLLSSMAKLISELMLVIFRILQEDDEYARTILRRTIIHEIPSEEDDSKSEHSMDVDSVAADGVEIGDNEPKTVERPSTSNLLKVLNDFNCWQDEGWGTSIFSLGPYIRLSMKRVRSIFSRGADKRVSSTMFFLDLAERRMKSRIATLSNDSWAFTALNEIMAFNEEQSIRPYGSDKKGNYDNFANTDKNRRPSRRKPESLKVEIPISSPLDGDADEDDDDGWKSEISSESDDEDGLYNFELRERRTNITNRVQLRSLNPFIDAALQEEEIFFQDNDDYADLDDWIDTS